jgi:hypothetical protein
LLRFTSADSTYAATILCRQHAPSEVPALYPHAWEVVPEGPDWLHEIKHDGFRLIVQRDGDRVRLFTRNGHIAPFEQGEIGPDLFQKACESGSKVRCPSIGIGHIGLAGRRIG